MLLFLILLLLLLLLPLLLLPLLLPVLILLRLHPFARGVWGDLICDTSCLYLQMVSIALGGGVCGDVSGLSPFVCVNASHKGAKTRKLQPVCTGCVVVRLVRMWWGRRAWGGAWGGDFQIRGLRPFCVCVFFVCLRTYRSVAHTKAKGSPGARARLATVSIFIGPVYPRVACITSRAL